MNFEVVKLEQDKKSAANKSSPGGMNVWMDECVDGWMEGSKSQFKDCSHQSKIGNLNGLVVLVFDCISNSKI